jgi:hypothetical protein
VFAALHRRQMYRLQQRTNQLAFQVSELKALISATSFGLNSSGTLMRAPSNRFDETTLST